MEGLKHKTRALIEALILAGYINAKDVPDDITEEQAQLMIKQVREM